MTFYGDFHTHTSYSDGENTPREMAESACTMGLSALGITDHAYALCDEDCCIPQSAVRPRYDALRALQREYADRLAIGCGIEQDVCGAFDALPYDYRITSMHYLCWEGAYICVEDTPARLQAGIQACFGGDAYAFVKAYYARLAEALPAFPTDIVGHFDVLTKFNGQGAFFDESDARYRRAALEALHAVLQTHRLFEVNTGAWVHGYRSEPYPAAFLLRALYQAGGEVILSSDSHSALGIAGGFADAAALCRACGFRYAKVFTQAGFKDVPLG
ncbi:MAG: histidinol-phosphatase HisJ family protein [Christensenellaceae bacterium]|jgi:histidinol-phosphatase (PHP family)|nr:histidinol-phosphatase HisJ family protein [Christensenellaceae bacterium]